MILKPPESHQGVADYVEAQPLVDTICSSDNTTPVLVMKSRSQYLACNNKLRQGTKPFLLQAHNRNDGDPTIHIGFTCSKKVGNAVARNRAKRRLREIAHLTLPSYGNAGWDYVLIGRKEVTATRDFVQLQADLRYALNKVHI